VTLTTIARHFIRFWGVFVKALNLPLPRFVVLSALLVAPINNLGAANPCHPRLPMEIKAPVLKSLPVKGNRIDQTVTGDFGESLVGGLLSTANQSPGDRSGGAVEALHPVD
jgi:hypothetical protein